MRRNVRYFQINCDILVLEEKHIENSLMHIKHLILLALRVIFSVVNSHF